MAVFESRERRLFGVQFHPEVIHTRPGRTVLSNFLFRLAGLMPDWSMKSFVARKADEIRRAVGREKVICGLSGGVDSLVASLIVHRAVGDRLTCVFVDNGLLRTGQYETLMDEFRRKLHLRVVGVDAADTFLRRLRNVTSPERKRKIIGRAFIDIFDREASRIGGARFLAQGTIYPDVIESAPVKGPSATIKSHHNVGGLPKGMKLKLVEPLRELFKDEVRALAAELGVDREFIAQHPFPGPGLAVRILGDVTPERIAILREADRLLEEVRRHGIYNRLWQAFAVLLPVRWSASWGPADLSAGRGPPSRPERRRHDRQLVSGRAGLPVAGLDPDRQRSRRRQPRRLRYHDQAAGDDRMGVAVDHPFIHLHNHSEFSVLDGAVRIHDLVEAAYQNKMPAVALTDHGNIFGAVTFFKEAKARDIKPILGCEVYVAPRNRFDKSGDSRDPHHFHLVLLVKNDAGYRNLCLLLSKASSKASITAPDRQGAPLGAHRRADRSLRLPQGRSRLLPRQGDRGGGRAGGPRIRHFLRPGNFYLEIQDHGLPLQKAVNPKIIALARRLDLPLIATNDIHYLRKEDAESHDVLLCIQTNKKLSDQDRIRFSTQEFFFKSGQEMAELFPEAPDAIRNSTQIAAQCNFSFPSGHHFLPVFKPPDGTSLEEYLSRVAPRGSGPAARSSTPSGRKASSSSARRLREPARA